MQVAADGSVDGWCWSPQRPAARLIVDILIDDSVVVTGEAAAFRIDLEAAGIGDGRHAFVLRLPQGALGRGGSCLVSGRERVSSVVFGRRLHEPAPGPEEPGIAALRAELAAISASLGALPRRRGPESVSQQLRQAAGELAAVLRNPGNSVAASRALLARHKRIELSIPRVPRASLVVWARDVVSMQRALNSLAPAARTLGAEVLACHTGEDARMLLLPSVTPGLVLVHAPAHSAVSALAAAAPQARAPWLLLVDPAAHELSASGIAHLLPQLDAMHIELALSDTVAFAQSGASAESGRVRRLAASARLGLLAAVRPALATAAADQAEPDMLGSLAHLAEAGGSWAIVDQPWPALS